MSAKSPARPAEAVAAPIPLVLALIVAALVPAALGEIVRQRRFTLRIGRVTLSARQTADQLGSQVESKLAEIAARTRIAPIAARSPARADGRGLFRAPRLPGDRDPPRGLGMDPGGRFA